MPMRIIGRGRDAYIVAGYLDKRGKWTPHWSERYFVLTPTSLHYFRKDRDQLFGDERGRISLDKIVVKPNPLKKNMFEIKHIATAPTQTHTNNVTNITTGSDGGGSIDGNDANTFSQIRHHTWILRAKKASEAEVWIDAINEAQHKLTPELLASSPAFQKLPPIPRDAFSLPQHVSSTYNAGGASDRDDRERDHYSMSPEAPPSPTGADRNFLHPNSASAAHRDHNNAVVPASRARSWQSGSTGSAGYDMNANINNNSRLDGNDGAASAAIFSPPSLTKSRINDDSGKAGGSGSGSSSASSSRRRITADEKPISISQKDGDGKLQQPPASIAVSGSSRAQSTRLQHSSVAPLSSSSKQRLAASNQDPLLFAVLEKAEVPASDSRQSTASSSSKRYNRTTSRRDILLGRYIEFSQPIYINAVEKKDVIYVCTYDGTPFHIPVSSLDKTGGEREYHGEGNLLRDVVLTIRYSRDRRTLGDIARALPPIQLATGILLPLLTLLLALATAGRRWIWKAGREFPLLDLRPLWGSGEVMLMSLAASIVSICALTNTYTELLKKETETNLTLTFVKSTLPPAASNRLPYDKPLLGRSYSGQAGRGYESGNNNVVSAFDMTEADDSDVSTTSRRNNRNTSHLYNADGIAELPSRPDTQTAAALRSRGKRTMSSVAEANQKLIEQEEDEGEGTEESEAHDADGDGDGDVDMHVDDDQAHHSDPDEPHEDDEFPRPSALQRLDKSVIESEELDRPIVKQDYFGAWTESDWTVIMCRGANYMSDNVKIPAGPHVFRLNQVHCVYNEEKVMHASARANSYADARYKALIRQRGLQEGDKLCQSEADFLSPLVVVNFTVPLGSHDKNGNLLLYFTRRIHSKRSRAANKHCAAPSPSPRNANPTSHHSTPNGSADDDPNDNTNAHSNAATGSDELASPHSAPPAAATSSSSTSTAAPTGAKHTKNRLTGTVTNLTAPNANSSVSTASTSSPQHRKTVSAHITNPLPSPQSHNDQHSSARHPRTQTDSNTYAVHSGGMHTGIDVDPSDCTWATGEESGQLDEDRLHAFDNMFANFLRGSDDYRNKRFKLIPRVADGGWVVKKVVGGKPAIIAKGVPLHYFYNEQKNYFEITVDCHVSSIANRIMGVVNSQAAKLVVDLTILFQGENQDELPEALMGGCRLIHAHLDRFCHINTLGI